MSQNNISQCQKILNLLSKGTWVCTSEMAALYMVDYRRRLVDLKEKGYLFASRRCTKHPHSMKEWKLISSPTDPARGPKMDFMVEDEISPLAQAFLQKWGEKEKKELTLF